MLYSLDIHNLSLLNHLADTQWTNKGQKINDKVYLLQVKGNQKC